jgi:hypothetical protein
LGNDVIAIAPWKISSATNRYEIDNIGVFPGVNAISMDLNSDSPLVLSQTVATVAGV